MNKQRIILLAASGIGMLSTFIPWAKVQVFFIKKDMTLFDTDVPAVGWLLLACFIVAAVFSFLGDDRAKPIGKSNRLVVLITGIAALLITIFGMLAWGFGDAASYTTFGMGIYLSFLTSLTLVVIPFVMKDNGEFEMPTSESLADDFKEIKEDIVEEVKEVKEDIVEEVKEVKDKIEEKLKDKDEK